jgi:hypothetical protein
MIFGSSRGRPAIFFGPQVWIQQSTSVAQIQKTAQLHWSIEIDGVLLAKP